MGKIYIRIPTTGKIYACEASDKEGKAIRPKLSQSVLFEIEQIIEEGIVVEPPKTSSEIEEAGGKIQRIFSDADFERRYELKQLAYQYIEEAQKKVYHHGLEMKILDADLSFDQKKLTFYFVASTRVDFRGLVVDMAKSFEKIIRLQQVGARDEAKYYGGIGKCGRELCCAKFLNNMEVITLEMAQAQEIAAAGASKLSGSCGKLMCCLSFESFEKGNCQECLERPKGAK